MISIFSKKFRKENSKKVGKRVAGRYNELETKLQECCEENERLQEERKKVVSNMKRCGTGWVVDLAFCLEKADWQNYKKLRKMLSFYFDKYDME